MPTFVRVSSDKKSGLISLEVDDEDPKFAADMANAHAAEVGKVLGRLAVSEAQQRRSFFEQQLKETKERLIKAETDLRGLQERSGVIVLDKQAESLILGAAQVRSAIADREIRLRVLRTSATEQNPDLMRLQSELQGLRAELVRMEAREGGTGASAADLPVGKLPEAAIDNIRARRELKLQETLLEAMVRQYETAKLDEAKEGPLLQQVDVAVPPDYKSKPARGLIAASSLLAALLFSSLWVVVRRYMALNLRADADDAAAWSGMKQAWRLRR
jgi:capsule polysaccharide export protein KpsE/RkpR